MIRKHLFIQEKDENGSCAFFSLETTNTVIFFFFFIQNVIRGKPLAGRQHHKKVGTQKTSGEPGFPTNQKQRWLPAATTR